MMMLKALRAEKGAEIEIIKDNYTIIRASASAGKLLGCKDFTTNLVFVLMKQNGELKRITRFLELHRCRFKMTEKCLMLIFWCFFNFGIFHHFFPITCLVTLFDRNH